MFPTSTNQITTKEVDFVIDFTLDDYNTLHTLKTKFYQSNDENFAIAIFYIPFWSRARAKMLDWSFLKKYSV